MVGAGLVNPITGQRWVKSWRYGEFLTRSLDQFAAIEAALSVPLVSRFRLQRRFSDDREAGLVRDKHSRGEFGDFVTCIDKSCAWIEPVFRVDLKRLVEGLRARWKTQGRLREAPFGARASETLTVWCVGAAELGSGRFDFVPWRASKGEILEVSAPLLDPGRLVHDGHWILPLGQGRAKIGATFVPDVLDPTITSEGRARLAETARRQWGDDYRVEKQECGIRLGTQDKRPVAGSHPENPFVGVLNGLGAKGALYGPELARQWVDHCVTARAFDPEVDVRRFWRK